MRDNCFEKLIHINIKYKQTNAVIYIFSLSFLLLVFFNYWRDYPTTKHLWYL